MSDQFMGRRRRQANIPVARVVALVVAVAAVGWLLALGEPARHPQAEPAPIPVAAPTWVGPAPVDIPGVLADGASYTPRLFMNSQTSIGLATGADGTERVILVSSAAAGSPGSFTELVRRLPADRAQINGFAVDGDTVVWMEAATRNGVTGHSLWRAKWSPVGPPVQVTNKTGEPNINGLATDVILAGGTVTWAVDAAGRTEIRSVPVGGGTVSTVRNVDGDYVLSAPPWVRTAPGNPVKLVNLSNNEVLTVSTRSTEVAICDPTWCRVTVTDGGNLAGTDLMHPDGSARIRVAGAESTPTIAEPTLLDRFVPLATDRTEGVGLSLYDLRTGRTELVTPVAANVAGRNGILWWSTGSDSSLRWHAVDLRGLA